MAKAASNARLAQLHSMIAEGMIARLEADSGEDLFTDAATLSVMVKFLKDNNVSADPAGADDLTVLRGHLEDQVAKQRAARAEKRQKALSLAEADLKVIQG